MHKQEQLDHPFTIPETDEAELVIGLPFQATPFTIAGDTEALIPIATAAYKAAERDEARQTRNVAARAVRAAVEPVRSPEDEILTGKRATIKAKLYDIANGTNMYELLLQKRQEERDLAMAKKLGLITADRCAKHEKQLATVRGMQ